MSKRTSTSRRLLVALLLAGGAHVALSPAGAQQTGARACTLDLASAATLLLPYFEVDLVHTGGRTTLFAVGNSAEAATVASVTLWTDLGVPTAHVNVYLTGYDMQTINLRDLFAGRLPQTASVGQDPGDTLSPRGLFSADVNLAACQGLLPPPPLPEGLEASLAAAHTGGFVGLFGGCAAQAFGDGIARGYVTIDAVHTCTTRSPADPGYFGAGGNGDASDANVLWGDYFLVDPAGNTAVGEPLVRVQAFPGRFLDGDATFYGRHVGHSGADDREPLPMSWATRFAQQGSFSGGTDLLVWRDPGLVSQPFDCAAERPAWYPLAIRALPFDEEENVQLFDTYPTLPPPLIHATPFPAMANRVSLATAPMLPSYSPHPGPPIQFQFGWLYLVFPGAQLNLEGHAWVSTLMTASGRFAVALGATPLDSGCRTSFWLPSQ